MKIVINDCFGGFGVSQLASDLFGIDSGTPRNDERLIAAVEKLGKAANGVCAELKVVEIPDDVDWVIEEYDGSEWIAERHRVWR